MSQIETLGFGAGFLYAMPAGGNQPTNPTPVQIGVIQNVKLTFSGDIKKLRGQYQYPVDTAVGNREIKGSFESAQFGLSNWNNIMFGESGTTAGGLVLQNAEAHSVPATGPFTVTVNNNTTPTIWSQDAGVLDATTGQPLQAVGTGPATGQYSVSAGVYTFAAADEGRALLINYYYTTTAGSSLQILNHPMGWGPIVSMDLTMPYQGFDKNIYLYNVRIGKIDLSTKQDDYTMGSSDWEAFANPAQQVARIYLPW
jgi:hypothetical protein